MSEFLVKKVEIEAYPVTEMQVRDGTVLLRFKSGQVYRFDRESYKKAVESIFGSAFKFAERQLEKSLLEKVNAAVEKNENKDRSVAKLSNVLVEFGQLDEEWFEQFDETWRNALANVSVMMSDKTTDTAEPGVAGDLIRTMSSACRETMAKLDMSDARRVQTAETGLEDFPLAYFYTDFDVRNGCEIWHKAVDPIILFGTPVESFD